MEIDPDKSSEEESSYEEASSSEEESEEEEEEPEQWAGDEDDVEQPPAPVQQSRPKPPPPQQQSQRSNREINPDFQDVNETGKWGEVSRREIYIAAVAAAVVIIAVVVVVVVLVTQDDSPSLPPPPPTAPPTPPPTAAPTPPPTSAPDIEVLTALRNTIGMFNSTRDSLETLPADEAFYEGKYEDPNQPANVRAMSWVLYGDPLNLGPSSNSLAIRYGLATLYYATGGPDWTNSAGWLTEAVECDWHGLFCDTQGRLDELDLNSNNMQNPLPNEIALLQDVRAFSVRRNSLTGTVPALAFHDIPLLSILYLDNNQFTGELDNLLAQGVLSVLFTQENNFERSFFPLDFCVDGSLTLDQAGLDCDVTRCLCCNRAEHCL